MGSVIGVTCCFALDNEIPAREQCSLLAGYSDAIYRAGGIPLALPVPEESTPELIVQLLDRCDGLLLIGGPDIDPSRYGCPAHPRTVVMHPRRERFDFEICRAADNRRMPMFGICGGHQMIHVVRGGCLIQHIDDMHRDIPIKHSGVQAENVFHNVRVEPDSHLASILGATTLEASSRHHQAVDPQHIGRGLRTVASADDGVIEASEDCDGRFLMSVQWHPEDLLDRTAHMNLFMALVDASSKEFARHMPPKRQAPGEIN